MGECLINVLKHTGPGARAEVVVDHQPRQLVVSITDDGRGLAASSDGGRGLAATSDDGGHGVTGCASTSTSSAAG